ncbi:MULTISPECIES: cupin domain-containing protein [unclassified Rathayibacter]|nr:MULTISPECIES: cupin domain-containing protein [unclassified Rathayibacter]
MRERPAATLIVFLLPAAEDAVVSCLVSPGFDFSMPE